MKYVRIMTVSAEGDQKEVARSAPNSLPATASFELPAEEVVASVKAVDGYGNIDIYLYLAPHEAANEAEQEA